MKITPELSPTFPHYRSHSQVIWVHTLSPGLVITIPCLGVCWVYAQNVPASVPSWLGWPSYQSWLIWNQFLYQLMRHSTLLYSWGSHISHSSAWPGLSIGGDWIGESWHLKHGRWADSWWTLGYWSRSYLVSCSGSQWTTPNGGRHHY